MVNGTKSLAQTFYSSPVPVVQSTVGEHTETTSVNPGRPPSERLSSRAPSHRASSSTHTVAYLAPRGSMTVKINGPSQSFHSAIRIMNTEASLNYSVKMVKEAALALVEYKNDPYKTKQDGEKIFSRFRDTFLVNGAWRDKDQAKTLQDRMAHIEGYDDEAIKSLKSALAQECKPRLVRPERPLPSSIEKNKKPKSVVRNIKLKDNDVYKLELATKLLREFKSNSKISLTTLSKHVDANRFNYIFNVHGEYSVRNEKSVAAFMGILKRVRQHKPEVAAEFDAVFALPTPARTGAIGGRRGQREPAMVDGSNLVLTQRPSQSAVDYALPSSASESPLAPPLQGLKAETLGTLEKTHCRGPRTVRKWSSSGWHSAAPALVSEKFPLEQADASTKRQRMTGTSLWRSVYQPAAHLPVQSPVQSPEADVGLADPGQGLLTSELEAEFAASTWTFEFLHSSQPSRPTAVAWADLAPAIHDEDAPSPGSTPRLSGHGGPKLQRQNSAFRQWQPAEAPVIGLADPGLGLPASELEAEIAASIRTFGAQ